MRLEPSFDVTTVHEGELHVYGTDETIASIRSRAAAGVRVVAHGSGLGVAWISASAELETAAARLAEDVVVFDQRGCLSPRIALVEGQAARVDAFADALHGELARFDASVPRGELPSDVAAASERYVTTMAYAGRVLTGLGHAVGVAPPGAPLVSSPPYRHVHVVPCSMESEGAAILAPLAPSLIAVGSDDEAAARRLAPDWARTSALGRMQKPPLDGPVDGRALDHA
jgi:hypothetical protein